MGNWNDNIFVWLFKRFYNLSIFYFKKDIEYSQEDFFRPILIFSKKVERSQVKILFGLLWKSLLVWSFCALLFSWLYYVYRTIEFNSRYIPHQRMMKAIRRMRKKGVVFDYDIFYEESYK